MPKGLGLTINGPSWRAEPRPPAAMVGTAGPGRVLAGAIRGRLVRLVALALLPFFVSGCRTVNDIRKSCYLLPTDTFSLGLIGAIEAFRTRNGDCLDVHTLRQAGDRPELPRLISRCSIPEQEKVVAWLCPAATPTAGNCVLFTTIGMHILNTRPDDIAGRQFLGYDALLTATLEPDRFRPYLLYLTVAGRKTVVNTFDYRLHDSRQFFATLQSYLESPDVPQRPTASAATADSASGTVPANPLPPPTAGPEPRRWWDQVARAVGARTGDRPVRTPEEIRQNCYRLPTDVFSLGLIQVLEAFKAHHPACADLHTLHLAQDRSELPALIARGRLAGAEKVLAWVCAEPFTAAPDSLLFTDAGVHVLTRESPEDPGTTFLSYGWIMAATAEAKRETPSSFCLTAGDRTAVIATDAWRLPDIRQLFETVQAYLESPGSAGAQTVLIASGATSQDQPADSSAGDDLGVSRMRRPPPAEAPADFAGDPTEALRKFQLYTAGVWHAVDLQLQAIATGGTDRSPGIQLRQVGVFLEAQLAALGDRAGNARVRHAFVARQQQAEDAARQAEARWHESSAGAERQAAATALAAERERVVRFAHTESDLAALATALRQLAGNVRAAEQQYWNAETAAGKEGALPQALADVRQLQAAWWQAYMR